MKFIKENLMQFALLIAAISTIGSLYFSEILKLPPCVLCWYQRILMYPLVIILTVGLYKKDKNLSYFVLPFAIIGLIISGYHNLLYYGFIPESITPCTQGVSCTTKQIEIFGFVTIPFMSLLSFLTITLLTFIQIKINKKTK